MVLTGDCDQQTIKEPHNWTIVFKDVCADCKLDGSPRSASQGQQIENPTSGKCSNEKNEKSNGSSTTIKTSSASSRHGAPKGHYTKNESYTDTDTGKGRTMHNSTMKPTPESESESEFEQRHHRLAGIRTKANIMSSSSKSSEHEDRQEKEEEEELVAEDNTTHIESGIPFFCENWDRVSVDYTLRQFIGRIGRIGQYVLLPWHDFDLVLGVLANIVLLVCVMALIALNVYVTGPDRFLYLTGPTEDTSTL
nr:hypothetical protein LTR18_007146 [Exophiala xenobiotica]